MKAGTLKVDQIEVIYNMKTFTILLWLGDSVGESSVHQKIWGSIPSQGT